MSRVLVVGHEELGERMSGPSIRNWELSRVLAATNDVTLAVPGTPGRVADDFAVRGYGPGGLGEMVDAADVVVASGYLLESHPELLSARHLVADLYDPFPLENLHMHKAVPLEEQYRIAAHDRGVLSRLTRSGDAFLCASSRQRDFWTGWLAASGRVNPYVHDVDPGLDRVLLTVPFGISNKPPVRGAPVFRGVMPGIGEEDFLVLWGGGIWNWFDPLTLIRAAARIASELPTLRVLFPAGVSPSEQVLPMRMAQEAKNLSDSLGLTGKIVFFGSGWIPYESRGTMLLEADVGVSLHLEDVETRYSFRTRVLDYLWAGLPIVTTEGDSMADLVEADDLGAVVPYGSVEALGDALLTLARDPGRRRSCSRRALEVAQRYRWEVAAAQLVEYCRAPWTAPDRAALRSEDLEVPWDGELPPRREAGRLANRALGILRAQGPVGLLRKSRSYLRRRISG